ncbi:MAG: 2-dehydropantoate 2-reductase [Nitrospiraceae bacterium]|nr:2-dehydropantoate 2-reductase [Nitrospiraceae bacterium]
MQVAVVGPGAMGCLFAARLAQSGVQTTLVDYKPDRAARLQESGITVDTADGSFVAKPTVTTRVPADHDLIIVLTKSYSVDSLQFPAEIPVLALQNGLNAVDALCAQIGSARLLAGVTCEAANLVGEGHTHHSGSGETACGSWTSCPVESAVAVLQKAGFEVVATEAPGQKIWEKAIISAAINPLTALLGVPNGKLVEMREARQLMRDLVVEATKVAATEGYRFDFSLVERAEDVCRQTAENISSMLQDVRARRQTEIEAISGEILRRAQFASLPTPRTRVVWQLVRSLEQR